MEPLVDSHCHLNMIKRARTQEGLRQVLDEAHAAGVCHMLCVSVDLETYPEVQRIAHEHASVSASVGVHPNHQDGRDPSVAELVELATDAQVVAIGETGLDYYRCEGDLEWQRERFRRHIRAAREIGKPVIVHMREAREDTLRILAEERVEEVGGVLHCFTEDWDTAQRVLDLGMYVSYSGIVTFRNAQAIAEAARRTPLDRLLVETDSPYLTPMPHRGKGNEPKYVRRVAEFVAELREQSLDEVARATTDNFFRLFSSARRDDRGPRDSAPAPVYGAASGSG